MPPRIIDRGRGPEVEGTRVTVYRVMDFLRAGSSVDRMAEDIGLTADQLEAALDYICAHAEEVVPRYDEIVARARRSNPDWVEARLARSPEELRRRFEARKERDPAHADTAG